MSKLPYVNQAAKDVHDSASPETTRVSLYGWDSVNSVKTRLTINEDGELYTVNGGHISTGNSTVTPLLADGVFTGTAEGNLSNAIIIINAFSDVASATNGLSFQIKLYGSDTWRVADVFTLPANTLKTWSFQTGGNEFRIVYTNGSSNQTVFELETQIKHANSKPSSHRIQDNISTEDDAELVTSVIKAEREGTPGTFYNVGADVSGNLKTVIGGISQDAGGRVRISQLTTLGDYKILNADRTLLLENAGTGTGAFTNNKYNMSVGSGEWLVRQSRRFHPYFSGKSHMIEATFDNFGLQENVTKRVGYFSSNATTPFASDYDGVWLENDGTKYIMKASRAGTETVSVDWTDWDNYDLVANHNWDNFTVILIDFLWLGGAVYRLWMKNGGGFTLLHTVHYAGTAQDVFIKSPNQPIRYEIRSTTGTGSMRYICAQCSTEGSINESGLGRSVRTGAVTTTTIGTTYPVLAIRKASTQRDIAVQVEDMSVYPTSTNDRLQWSLQLNPTLSAGLTYGAVANSAVESAVGNGTITVTGAGTILVAGTISTGGQIPVGILKQNFLSFLGSTLTNTMDEYVLCVTPITSNITSYSTLSFKEI